MCWPHCELCTVWSTIMAVSDHRHYMQPYRAFVGLFLILAKKSHLSICYSRLEEEMSDYTFCNSKLTSKSKLLFLIYIYLICRKVLVICTLEMEASTFLRKDTKFIDMINAFTVNLNEAHLNNSRNTDVAYPLIVTCATMSLAGEARGSNDLWFCYLSSSI